jgi:hypothetical protein
MDLKRMMTAAQKGASEFVLVSECSEGDQDKKCDGRET